MWAKFQNNRQSYLHPLESNTFQGSVFWTLALSYLRRLLRTKQARDVGEMIADIYKAGPLTYPSTFQCDNGSEFKGELTKMLEKHGVKIQRVMMKYKHTHTAFVEALNKILTERLFRVQDAQELNHPEKVSSRWDKHLYGLVDELNDMETEVIGMKPKDAIKLDEVPLVA